MGSGALSRLLLWRSCQTKARTKQAKYVPKLCSQVVWGQFASTRRKSRIEMSTNLEDRNILKLRSLDLRHRWPSTGVKKASPLENSEKKSDKGFPGPVSPGVSIKLKKKVEKESTTS